MSNNKICVFIGRSDNKFEISSNALNQLRKYKQNHPKKLEAGGVLLGRYIISSDDIVVDRITEPMEGDKRKRFRFFRSACSHQKIIDQEWLVSDGTGNYLGEWHTHPESNPKPSPYDLMNWKRKLLFDKFDSDSLFFIILGINEINVWQGYKNSVTIEKLRRVV